MATKSNNPVQAIPQIVDLLGSFSDDEQSRIIQGVVSYLGLDGSLGGRTTEDSASSTPAGNRRDPVFSGHEELSPKAFLKDKEPQTDIERVACLAYYLTHYRESRYFKTIDISTLNTEAAQRKFTNATFAIRNTSTRGYLAPAPQKTHKQITAIGEQYVEALPDRQLAKAVMEKSRLRRTRKKKKIASRRAQRG